MTALLQFINDHATSVSVGGFYVFSSFASSLPAPEPNSSKWYQFFHNFVNRLVANSPRGAKPPIPTGGPV